MASNLTVSFPQAVGAALPPVELKYFGNESASTKDSNVNYVTTNLPTTPVDGNIKYREQYTKGQVEWPR